MLHLALMHGRHRYLLSTRTCGKNSGNNGRQRAASRRLQTPHKAEHSVFKHCRDVDAMSLCRHQEGSGNNFVVLRLG